ncbi:MAG: BTAD domain-containing putative transcriptional regulator [Candidatus Nanopelagicales bacterium]
MTARYRVLGPVGLEVDGAEADLGGPLPRRLLCVLLEARGRAVPVEVLVDELWDLDPPGRPQASIQGYVSGLRRALGPHRGDLSHGPGGYRLRVAEGALDADAFAAEVERGRVTLAAGDAGGAADEFRTALGRWRGRPYDELLPGRGESERTRLADLRAGAEEDLLEARLALGEAAAVAAEAEALIERAPLRERRWALLALATYRDGRQGDALGCLRQVRRLLADRLGIDPGPALQDLERRILAQDPALLASASAPEVPRAADGGGEAPPPPTALTSFVGRSAELAELDRLLAADRRLVTVVGPGGAGKTRLALEWVSADRDRRETVWWLRAGDVQDADLVGVSLVQATGQAALSEDPVAAVRSALTGGSAVLVVDNAEHLVEPLAAMVTRLLAGCPRLRVLVTSREPLGVDGEALLPLGPLPVDAALPGAGPSRSDAVRLLLDRVAAQRPGWEPDAADLHTADLLVRRLDGMPLAVELAASRARVLSLADLLRMLDERVDVLGAVPRSDVVRHASLEDAIAWSVDPLAAPERDLLLRLWPFEGGFPLDAAEAVTAQPDRTLLDLSTLVTRSLVLADTSVSPTRFRLLETVRAYCRTRDDGPDPDEVRAAHAAWVEALTADADADLRGPHAGRVLVRFEQELGNVRAALAHDLPHDPRRALRVAGRLGWFWYRRGHVAEGLRWLDRALEAAAPLAAGAPAADEVRAREARAALLYLDGRLPESGEEIDRAVRLAETGPEVPDWLRGLAHARRGYFRVLDLDGPGALADAAAAQDLALAGSVDWLAADAVQVRGPALALTGDLAGAESALRAAARAAEACGYRWCASSSEWILGTLLLMSGRAPEVPSLLAGATLRLVPEHDRSAVLACAISLAGAWAATGRVDDGLALVAAAGEQGSRIGYSPQRMDPRSMQLAEALLDAAVAAEGVGADRRAAAEARGRGWDWDAMVAAMTADAPGRAGAPGATSTRIYV